MPLAPHRPLETAPHRGHAAARAVTALLGVLLLLLSGLTACHEAADEGLDGEATAPVPVLANSPARPVPTVEPASSDPSDDGGQQAPERHGRLTVSGTDAPLTRTQITGVWPDASWTIEELPGDACAAKAPEISRWVLGEDYFSCGAEEDGLIACKHVQGDEALCVRDPLERTAVRIHSPAIESFTAPSPEAPLPLMVVLADGMICEPVARDDVEHHEGRQSWLYCGENAALLLDLETASMYFQIDGPIWTAELGVGAAAPETVQVRAILYAGTPEDVQAQGFVVG